MIDRENVPDAGRWWHHRTLLISLGLALLCVFGALALYLVESVSAPQTSPELRQDLARHAEAAQSAFSTLDNLWRRLEEGESIRCDAAPINRPYFVDWREADRDAAPGWAALADQLNNAIRDLHRAADIWTTACQSDEVALTPNDAATARAALERAATGLAAVESALAMRSE